jgi:hypothetical protein
MDTTIQSLFATREQQTPQVLLGDLINTTKIGIEVEVENITVDAPIKGWRCIGDGSLRDNGVEYVFKGPVGGLSATRRLDSLCETLSAMPDIRFSHRTSVHVHVDVRDMTWNELIKYVILYAMIEPYLFAVCGKERDEGIYSLSLYRGKDQVSKLSAIARLGPDALRSERYWSKYSSVNLLSVPQFGSLEFRGHEGTADRSRLINWVNHLLKLKEYAISDSNKLTGLPKVLSNHGPMFMLREILGDDLINSNISSATSVLQEVYEGVSIAEDLLYDMRFRSASESIRQTNNGFNQLEKIRDRICVD